MKRQTNHRSESRTSLRSGFTLVEMLVSVALILLMMTMFASIFTMATDSVSTQRAIAENDQRVRSIQTVIQSDFQHRTFRYPLAFYPGEDSATSPTRFGDRAGYLYISTNDPTTGLDDLVQFTVSSDIVRESSDNTRYFGKAQILSDRTFATATRLSVNPNQPEADDGSLLINGTSSSPAAEVSYFVRQGNLYRRVMLLRSPLAVAGQDFSAQPTTSRGYNLVSGVDDTGTYDGQMWSDLDDDAAVDAGELSNNFWRHFDFSAIVTGYPATPSAQLIGAAALNNELASAGAGNESLGNPRFRFGFNQFTGFSREHDNLTELRFLGRFTQAETSSVNFNWPHGFARVKAPVEDAGAVIGVANNGNPLDLVNTPVTLNPGNGVVSEFDTSVTAGIEGRGGDRRMEDLLLSNVHEMKIEIWDDRLQRFVTPGHEESTVFVIAGNPVAVLGDYHQFRNLNRADIGPAPNPPLYGPLGNGSSGRVFDTWHPAVSLDFDGGGTVTLSEQSPPYIPYQFHPPRAQDVPPGPSAATMPAPATEQPRNRGYWQPNFSPYSVGDVVFVPWIDLPVVSPPGPPDGLFQYNEVAEPKFQIAYRCVQIAGGGSSGGVVPLFPSVPGRRITDNEVIWESFDNRRPLQSMRMTIRFVDQKSDTMRQLTMIIPLTDKK